MTRRVRRRTPADGIRSISMAHDCGVGVVTEVWNARMAELTPACSRSHHLHPDVFTLASDRPAASRALGARRAQAGRYLALSILLIVLAVASSSGFVAGAAVAGLTSSARQLLWLRRAPAVPDPDVAPEPDVGETEA